MSSASCERPLIAATSGADDGNGAVISVVTLTIGPGGVVVMVRTAGAADEDDMLLLLLLLSMDVGRIGGSAIAEDEGAIVEKPSFVTTTVMVGIAVADAVNVSMIVTVDTLIELDCTDPGMGMSICGWKSMLSWSGAAGTSTLGT